MAYCFRGVSETVVGLRDGSGDGAEHITHSFHTLNASEFPTLRHRAPCLRQFHEHQVSQSFL